MLDCSSAAATDPGVVYQHRQACVLLQGGLDAGEIFLVTEIGLQDLDATTCLVAYPGSERVESSPVAGDECKVIAAPREPLSVGCPNAARRSRVEGGPVAMKRHSVCSPDDCSSRTYVRLVKLFRNVVNATFTDIPPAGYRPTPIVSPGIRPGPPHLRHACPK